MIKLILGPPLVMLPVAAGGIMHSVRLCPVLLPSSLSHGLLEGFKREFLLPVVTTFGHMRLSDWGFLVIIVECLPYIKVL